MNYTRSIEFNPPIRLDKALIDRHKAESSLQKTNSFLDIFINNVGKDENLASTPVKKYIGRGSSAIVFETVDGDILKLTNGNHFPMNRPKESFDVPIFKEGKVGKIHYYVEQKLLQHGLTDGFVLIMRDYIKEKGYKCSDLEDGNIFQIGICPKGKLYLIDPECAKYKTVFHAIFSKLKHLLIK